MRMNAIGALSQGDELPTVTAGKVDRLTLALYAGASGDHNPIHVDSDFAKQAGMPDVFAHGMLIMAWLGRALTEWVEPSELRSYKTRFAAMTQVGETISCRAKVVDKFEMDGETRLRLELTAVNEFGEVKLAAEAVVGSH